MNEYIKRCKVALNNLQRCAKGDKRFEEEWVVELSLLIHRYEATLDVLEEGGF